MSYFASGANTAMVTGNAFINTNLHSNLDTAAYVGNNWGVNPPSETYNPALDYVGVFRPAEAGAASDDEWVRNFQGTRAFAGKNKFMGRFVYGLVLRNVDWATDPIHGFPMRETTDRTFEWEVIKFNEVVSPILPHEAPTRLAKSSTERGSASMIRHGFGMLWEHDWMKTLIGQQYWFWNLQQIVNATTLAIYFDVIRAMLQTRAKWVETLESNDLLKGVNRQNTLCEFASNAFAPHKSGEALKAIIDRTKAHFRSIGVDPRTIIVPGGYGYFFRGLGPENIEFFRAGPAGPARKEIDAEQISEFRGLTIIQTRARDVRAFMQVEEDALVRRRFFGEHYVTVGPTLDSMDKDRIEAFRSLEMSSEIHVPHTYRKITQKQLIENYKFFTAGGYFEEPGMDIHLAFKGEADMDNSTGLLFAGPDGKYAHVLGEIHPRYLSNKHIELMARSFKARADDDRDGDEKQVYVSKPEPEPEAGGAPQGTGYTQRARSATRRTFSGLDLAAMTAFILSAMQAAPQNNPSAGAGNGTEEFSDLANVYHAYMADPHPDLADKDVIDAKIANLLQSDDPVRAYTEGFAEPASTLLNPDALRPERAAAIEALLQLPVLEAVPEKQTGMWIPAKEARPEHVHLDPVSGEPLAKPRTYSNAERMQFQEVSTKLSVEGDVTAAIDAAPYPIKVVLSTADTIDFPDERQRLLKDVPKELKSYVLQVLYMPPTQMNLLYIDANNIIPPFEWLFTRHLQEFLTSSMIVARNGEGTGSTLFANPDWMVQDDALTKMHQGSWSIEHTTVIWKAENIRVLDDMFIRAYQGGRNEKFFTKGELEDLRTDMYAPGQNTDRGSIICTPVPYGTSRQLPEVICAAGWFDAEEKANLEKRHFVTTSAFYEQFATNGEVFGHLSDDRDTPSNVVLFQGHQRCYNHSAKEMKYNAIRNGAPSHLGKNIYADVLRDMMDPKGGLQKEMNYDGGAGWISAESL